MSPQRDTVAGLPRVPTKRGICPHALPRAALGAPGDGPAPKSQLTGVKWRAAHFFKGKEARRIMESFNCLAWLDV